jgi:nucleoside-diphosphate-sugar epimerase
MQRVKRAFVTGGSGFLGRHLLAALTAERGIAVAALARSEAAAAAVRAAGAEPVRGDLDDAEALARGMAGCDTVIHAAAFVKQHGRLAEMMRVNVTGTERVLMAAQGAGVRRFVHVGTEAVLADGRPIVQADEQRPYPARPAGPYPITKGLAERAVRAANRTGTFETVVVRPRFIWGVGDTSVMPQLVDAVRRGRFAWLSGGRYLTSTCHVVNVVEGTLLAAERGHPGEVYFLTDGEPVELRAFMTDLLATQGVDPGSREVPRWVARALAALTSWMAQPLATATAIALAGVEVTVVDAKARRELGYAGAKTREAGLAELRAAGPATP